MWTPKMTPFGALLIVTLPLTSWLLCFFKVCSLKPSVLPIGSSTELPRQSRAVSRDRPCFVAFEFAAPGQFLEQPQDLKAMRAVVPGFRYILFTNDEELETPEPWEKVVLHLDKTKYTKPKTHSSYAKFLGWQHPATQSCRVIFTLDGQHAPVNNVTIWRDLEHRVRESPGGLLLQPKPNGITIEYLLKVTVIEGKKDTKEKADQTLEYLESRPDYSPDAPCYWTNFMGYDPTNKLFQEAALEYWRLYSVEMLSLRDQPYFSYIVRKFNLQPSLIYTVSPNLRESKPYVEICTEKIRLECQEAEDRAREEGRSGPYADPFFKPDLLTLFPISKPEMSCKDVKKQFFKKKNYQPLVGNIDHTLIRHCNIAKEHHFTVDMSF